jgi:hypothetical protein
MLMAGAEVKNSGRSVWHKTRRFPPPPALAAQPDISVPATTGNRRHIVIKDEKTWQ